MKKATLAFFAVALAGILSAFTSKTSSTTLNDLTAVGISISPDQSKFFVETTSPGMPRLVPSGWVKGQDYDCSNTGLCTVIVDETATLEQDPASGQYFYDANEVIDHEDGEFTEF